MADTVLLKSLHLEYRLWIAELNLDINLIRIFNDRLLEITAENRTERAKNSCDEFGTKFNATRNTIDELRHRLHIEKMNLAATARENSVPNYKIDVPANYQMIREEFFDFRVAFDQLKNEFLSFEHQ